MALSRLLVATHICCVGSAVLLVAGGSPRFMLAPSPGGTALIVRTDEAGMSHSVNIAKQGLKSMRRPVG
jgi:hypothetical protein